MVFRRLLVKKYRPSLKFAEISACELLGVFLGLGLLTGKDEKFVSLINTERKNGELLGFGYGISRG